MLPRRLTSRELNILVMCIFMVVVYVGYHLVYKPLNNRLLSLEGRIEIARKKIREKMRILQREDAVKSEYRTFESLLKQKQSDSREMASILAEIEAVANQVGLRLADLKPRKVRSEGFFNQFSVSLSVEGEMPLINRFLYLLENEPYLYDIDDVQLEKRSVRTSLVRCELQLSRFLIP